MTSTAGPDTICTLMLRRTLLTALAGVAAFPGLASAQRQYRVGILSAGPDPVATNPVGRSLLAGLAKAGYVPGRNMVLQTRGADGQLDRLPALLQELVAGGPDVIVTNSYPAALVAKEQTTLPIVALAAGDPVGTGLVESLARPGGHVTGISDVSAELTPKRMELLQAMAPGLRRIAILWNDNDRAMQLRTRASEAGARTMSIGVQELAVRAPADIEATFKAMSGDKPDALLIVADALTLGNTKRILDLVAAQHIPAMYEYDYVTASGGLMSYAPDPDESAERVGALVDRILKGTRPADLPFEQPTRFKLVINLKTARSLGITVPPSLLARADDVIE